MTGIKFHCPNCGQHLEAPVEAIGCPVSCPTCQHPLQVPPASAVPSDSKSEQHPVSSAAECSICQTRIQPGETTTACPECKADYHTECWQENGGCAVYGCARAPAAEPRRAIEIPVSYWGQENKPCPSCGQAILAAAVRCRHCGATFASARPEDADEFQRNVLDRERGPAMKRTIIWLFVFSVVPCLAPIGAVWGLVWYPLNRKSVRALPSVFPALCKIGLTVAIGQCALVAFMAAWYAASQNY